MKSSSNSNSKQLTSQPNSENFHSKIARFKERQSPLTRNIITSSNSIPNVNSLQNRGVNNNSMTNTISQPTGNELGLNPLEKNKTLIAKSGKSLFKNKAHI